MITKKQWKTLVRQVRHLHHTYDIEIHGNKLIFSLSEDILQTRLHPGTSMSYIFPDSFMSKKPSLKYVKSMIQLKTKPAHIIDCSLKDWEEDKWKNLN